MGCAFLIHYVIEQLHFDLEVLDLREQWMRRTDVAKYYGSVGHDNLIMEFNEHVIKYYDNTFGSVKVKKEMKVEPEISQAADVLHDKYLTMLDELSHNKDYLGRGKESNIVIARRFCPCLAPDICQKLLTCFAA